MPDLFKKKSNIQKLEAQIKELEQKIAQEKENVKELQLLVNKPN